MTHAEFLADYAARNMPASTGGRARKSQQPSDVVAQQAAAAWLVYNTPHQVMSRALQAAGGSYWTSADLSKKRVYFNDIEVTPRHHEIVYFDVLAGTWHDRLGGALAPEVEAIALAIVAA